MHQLIICEKPAQAKEYVNVFTKYLSTTFKNEKGYYTNGTITISYAIGHLIQLADAHIYDPKYTNWNLDDLPIIPEKFQYVVSPKTKEQYLILKDLIKKSNVIYNAADAEREGELIFRLILNQTKENISNKIIKRIWLTDYQYDTIVKSYENAKMQQEYDNLYDAARARQIADWLIGINATRTLTVASKTNTTLTLGRVQTAILRLIVDRYNKVKNFIVEDTFTPYIEVNTLELALNKSFLVLNDAKNILNQTKDKVQVLFESEIKTIKQPVLFSLTDLQILCNNKYNFSATKTLEIAQNLYENKLISYPRTSSNYLTEALKSDTKIILDSLIKNYYKEVSKEQHEFIQNIDSHFIFNDAKTSDHYAIIPLKHNTNDLEKLKDEEKTVFNEIMILFFKCFSKEALIEEIILKVETDLQNVYYINTFKKTKYKGFLFFDNKKENEQDILMFNSLNKKDFENGELTVTTKNIKKGKTTSPLYFTEATLLKAMKNPTSYEKIEENKNFIKSLGTPATNDKFLPILLKRNYVSIEKKYIIPKELGIKIISSLIETKLTSISLSAQIEFELENINNGKQTFDKFIEATKRFTKNITTEIKQFAEVIGENVEEKQRVSCPSCKTGFLYLSKSKKNYYCSNFKSEPVCDFVLFLLLYGKKMTDANISDLINKRKTKLLEFTNSKNVKYKAQIILNELNKTQMVFDDSKKGSTKK